MPGKAPFFIDLHVHSTLNVFNKYDKNFWKYDPPNDKQRSSSMNRLVFSPFLQAAPSSVSKGKVRIAYITLYPIEQGFFFNLLPDAMKLLQPDADKPISKFKKAVEQFLADKILEPMAKDKAMKWLAAKIIFNMDDKRFKEIYDDQHDYFEDLVKEYTHLITQLAKGNTWTHKGELFEMRLMESTAQAVQLMADYESSTLTKNVILLVPTIEGGHSLGLGSRKAIKAIGDKYLNVDHRAEFVSIMEKDVAAEPRLKALYAEVAKNIDAMKEWRDGRHCPMFITLNHHFYNMICGHSMSFAGFMNKLFDQRTGMGHGMTDFGLKIVAKLLERHPRTGKRILIDCKHMSVDTRKTYYAFLENYNAAHPNDKVPLISSHTAVNGYKKMEDVITSKSSHEEMDDYYKLLRDVNGPWSDSTQIPSLRKRFNPWDIGLSDEEIERIAQSRGLIGIILDERVSAGVVMNKKVHELSDGALKEKNELLYKSAWLQPFTENLLHIFNVLSTADLPDGYSLFDFVSIGSDFDGMINAVDAYNSCEDYATMQFVLLKKLRELQPYSAVLRNVSLEAVIEKVMYRNAYSFLIKNFN